MKEIITDRIPAVSRFYNSQNQALTDFDFKFEGALDYKAICYFVATGFFLRDTTYFKNLKTIDPSTKLSVEDNNIKRQEQVWDWHYSPRDITLEQAVDEFAELLAKITKEQVGDNQVVVPLSGGLDSRTQAAVLGSYKDVLSYSYKFENGKDENFYAEAVAKAQGFDHTSYVIPKAYLWDIIDEIATLNHCLSDFTHPRPMAIKKEIAKMGDVFFLGHWGDVLFDDMDVSQEMSEEEQVQGLYKKVVKKGGAGLAQQLWEAWDLEGTFEESFRADVAEMLAGIKIDNMDAKIRAFKSKYWAPRWTSTNLCVWQDLKPTFLPFYHDEMCEFICTIPEKYLAGRQIQIEYLKKYTPQLAEIPWQSFHPLNLYNYKDYYTSSQLPKRIKSKIKREFNERILRKPPTTLRNWELQFLGESNDKKLKEYIFGDKDFERFIPKSIVADIYINFKEKDAVWYSHPLSMLLTLSVFTKKRAV